jgi:hypothetical protein
MAGSVMWYGWIDTQAQSDIEWIGLRYPHILLDRKYAYISCIDSTRDMTSLPLLLASLRRRNRNVETGSRGLWLDASTVLDLATADRTVFNGFDEVWLFDAKAQVQLPEGMSITSECPITEYPDEAIAAVSRWMELSGCVLGIGDGAGLNYITTDKSIQLAFMEIKEHGFGEYEAESHRGM